MEAGDGHRSHCEALLKGSPNLCQRTAPRANAAPLSPQLVIVRYAGSAGFTAVINRDLDGAVLGSGFANYTSSAYACASLCKNTTGANIWVWCGSTFGCTTGQGSYQQDLSK